MFSFFSNHPANKLTLCAPASGSVVPLEQIDDDTFRGEVLGRCFGLLPDDGALYAPCDGVVDLVADTGHAVGLNCRGAELLLHEGIDTVMLGGAHFSPRVRVGDKVKRGDLLLTFDLRGLIGAGVDTTLVMVLTNAEQYATLNPLAGGTVRKGEPFLQLER